MKKYSTINCTCVIDKNEFVVCRECEYKEQQSYNIEITKDELIFARSFLSKRESDVFDVLAKHQGSFVSRDEIRKQLNFKNNNNIAVHIISIRKKLSIFEAIEIQTIHNNGYILK